MNDTFDFDQFIERRTTPGDKWGRYRGRDVLPLWVADMDFAAPPAVIEALHQRVAHGVFGYTAPWPSLNDAVVEGIARDHDWQIKPEWLVWLPGVVTGLNLACRLSGDKDSGVLTTTPVYPPFLAAPGLNERHLIKCEPVLADDRWTWPQDHIERAVAPDTSLLMLCNPHNPTGRVFDHAELTAVAELCRRHELLICADEIHCGLVLDPARHHIPIASLNADTAQRTITLMAPSKTWNIPALYSAFAIIPNSHLRARFQRSMRGIVPQPNVLGLTATEAAYRYCEPWRQALLAYLRGNCSRVEAAVADMPGLRMLRPEATYLAWIDCRPAGLENPAAFFEQAGVGLSDGADFGMNSFVRLNFGCPRKTLDQALERMQHALNAPARRD